MSDAATLIGSQSPVAMACIDVLVETAMIDFDIVNVAVSRSTAPHSTAPFDFKCWDHP